MLDAGKPHNARPTTSGFQKLGKFAEKNNVRHGLSFLCAIDPGRNSVCPKMSGSPSSPLFGGSERPRP